MTDDKEHQKLFRFLEWEVYKDAQSVFLEVLKVVEDLPQSLRFTLGSQIVRAALSIVLNIAEGSGRNTDKELNRFFDIAIGSINETVAALDTLMKGKFLSPERFQILFRRLSSISRQLGGFKKSIQQS
ncbi:MAG: four helix bundle protein [Candidatus Liptonbacteria bacterium]|nr:four helix bundle protein [Candidatus Liptonbacteria bacterium]